MKLSITGFAQSVDLDDPQKVNHFLVVTRENGTTFHLPVLEETTKGLIQQVYNPAVPELSPRDVVEELQEGRRPPMEPELTQRLRDGATEFGGEEDDAPLLEEEDEVPEEEDDAPASEDEVPSL